MTQTRYPACGGIRRALIILCIKFYLGAREGSESLKVHQIRKALRKKCFSFYPIRRIGMESPQAHDITR